MNFRLLSFLLAFLLAKSINCVSTSRLSSTTKKSTTTPSLSEGTNAYSETTDTETQETETAASISVQTTHSSGFPHTSASSFKSTTRLLIKLTTRERNVITRRPNQRLAKTRFIIKNLISLKLYNATQANLNETLEGLNTTVNYTIVKNL